MIYEALLRITRPLVLVFVPGVFQVVEDPDLPFRLPGAANAPNPSLGDAVLPGEFLVVVAGELFLDAGVADGAGEALGLRDIDRSASDDLGQLVEVIRPDCLGDHPIETFGNHVQGQVLYELIHVLRPPFRLHSADDRQDLAGHDRLIEASLPHVGGVDNPALHQDLEALLLPCGRSLRVSVSRVFVGEDLAEQLHDVRAVSRAGRSPPAPLGIVRRAQPFHIGRDATGDQGEARIDALVHQGLGGGIRLEVLDLRPDAGARVGEARCLSGGVSVEGSDPGVVVLSREDNPAELKIAGFVEALREGHVAPDALGLALLDEHAGQLLHGAARELRGGVLAQTERGHLRRGGPGLAHDLGIISGARRGGALHQGRDVVPGRLHRLPELGEPVCHVGVIAAELQLVAVRVAQDSRDSDAGTIGGSFGVDAVEGAKVRRQLTRLFIHGGKVVGIRQGVLTDFKLNPPAIARSLAAAPTSPRPKVPGHSLNRRDTPVRELSDPGVQARLDARVVPVVLVRVGAQLGQELGSVGGVVVRLDIAL